jgi:hypothetical protein
MLLESLELYFNLLFHEKYIDNSYIHYHFEAIKIIVRLCNGFFLRVVYVGETQIRK